MKFKKLENFEFPSQFGDIIIKEGQQKNQQQFIEHVTKGSTYANLERNIKQIFPNLIHKPSNLFDNLNFVVSLFYRFANDKELRQSQQFAGLITLTSNNLQEFLTSIIKQNSQEILIKLAIFLSLLFLSSLNNYENSKTNAAPALEDSNDEMNIEDSSNEQQIKTTNKRPNIEKNIAKYLIKLIQENLLKQIEWNDFPLMHLIISGILSHLEIDDNNRAQNLLFEVFQKVLDQLNEHEQRITIITRLTEWALQSEDQSKVLASIVTSARQRKLSVNSKILNQFLTEIVNIYLINSNTKSGVLTQKAQRVFIIQVCKEMPKLFQQETLLHTLLQLFENVNYFIRNTGVLSVTHLLLSNQLQDHLTKELLNLILQRHMDQNAHARSCALNVYETLIEKKFAPVRKPLLMDNILEYAINRLEDKSSFVRKSALLLLQQLINYFFNLYKVQNKGEERFLSHNNSVSKLEKIKKNKQDILNEGQKLEEKIMRLAMNKENSGKKFKQYDEKGKEIIEEDSFKNVENELKRLNNSLIQIQEKEKLLTKYLGFYESIKLALQSIKKLLHSKYNTDVIESIEIIVLLFKTCFGDYQQLLKYIMVLIYSDENNIKDCILGKFNQIIFQCSVQTDQVAKTITIMIKSCDMMEIVCLEEIFIQIQKTQQLPKGLIDQLVRYFFTLWIKSNDTQPQPQDLHITVKALRLLINDKPKLVHENAQSLQQFLMFYDQKPDQVDFLVLKEVITMIGQVMESSTDRQNQNIYVNIVLIIRNILHKTHGCDKPEWMLACDLTITLLFQYNQDPEVQAGLFMNKLVDFLVVRQRQKMLQKVKATQRNKEFLCDLDQDQMDQELVDCGIFDQNITPTTKEPQQIEYENKITQTLFAVSNICLKLLVYADDIKQKLVVIKLKAQQKQAKDLERKRNKNGQDITDQDELDQIQGGFEREFEEKYIRIDNLIENIMDTKSAPAYLSQVCVKICQDLYFNTGEQSIRNKMLDQIAVLALQKFMCFNHKFTVNNLKILFNLLESRHVETKIKNNILIGLADVCFRYPLDMEPYLPQLINCLNDRESIIKRTSLMIITHLVLMDLLKTKQNIGRIAKMLNDSDEKIQQQVKLFFLELNKKDQRSWQVILPELIGQMALDTTITDEDFTKFTTEIIPYIEKEKVTEGLIEKFIERFMLYSQEAEQRRTSLTQREIQGQEELMEFNPMHMTSERECKFLSICLSSFTYNLNNLRKLIQGYEYYRQFLRIEFIFQRFQIVLQKCKKYAQSIKANDSKKRKKQPKTMIQGQEMSANQEYNFLIQMLEENMKLSEKSYHLGKLPTSKPTRAKPNRANQKQNKARRKINQFIDDNDYDNDSNSYQIDYSYVNKPAQNKKIVNKVAPQVQEPIINQNQTVPEIPQHISKIDKKSKPAPIDMPPVAEEESSLDIEF